jgi:hypothetical protein
MDREGSGLGPVPTPDTSGVEFGWPGFLGEQGARVIRVVMWQEVKRNQGSGGECSGPCADSRYIWGGIRLAWFPG